MLPNTCQQHSDAEISFHKAGYSSVCLEYLSLVPRQEQKAAHWVFLTPLQQLPKLLSVQLDCKGENAGQERRD